MKLNEKQLGEISNDSFSEYPPQARQLAEAHETLLRTLPRPFAALLLREVSNYDWQFPMERRSTEDQLAFVGSLAEAQRSTLLSGFSTLSLSLDLQHRNAASQNQEFLDRMTTHLWATNQISQFDRAAADYVRQWRQANPESAPPQPRLCIVILEEELKADGVDCFAKLRPHGTFFSHVRITNIWQPLNTAIARRCDRTNEPYQHWLIDGTESQIDIDHRMTRVSWKQLSGMRESLLRRMQKDIDSGQGNAESTRTLMARTKPSDLGIAENSANNVLTRFEMNLLTQGSGAQVFSTSFVQWAAREALRRAQPCTLVLRYGCRVRQSPNNELLPGPAVASSSDPEGSLIDADMGAFYTWINATRLTGSEDLMFVAWSQAQQCAVAISPRLPRGTISPSTPDFAQMLAYLL